MFRAIFGLAFLLFAAASFVLRRRSFALFLALIVCAAFAFGAWRAQTVTSAAGEVPMERDGKTVLACEGVVDDQPRMKEWGASFDLDLASCGKDFGSMSATRGKLRVNARFIPDNMAGGDRVRALLAVKEPRVFRDPGAFDYREYLKSLGIGAVASAKSPVTLVQGEEAWSFSRSMARIRGRVADSIDAAMAPKEAAVVRALAIGDKTLVTPELRNSFSRSGLAHLLALSGLHVAYVALIVYFLIRFTLGLVPALVSRVPVKVMAAAVTIPAVWVYLIFTGCPVSGVRAGVMISVYLAARIIMRRPDALSSIAIAVIAIVGVAPQSMLSVSFQLSVLAVLGIALIATPLTALFGKQGERQGAGKRILHWLIATAAVSFAAGLATAPMVAYHFKTFTAVGLFANMIAVPLTGFFLQPFVLVATAVAAVAPDSAAWLWSASGFFARTLIAIASFSSDVGDPLIGRWAPTIAETALAYAAIGFMVAWKRLPYRTLLVSSLAIVMFTDVIYYKALPSFDKRLRVTFFDVGQGEAALVRFPGGETLLIDGGGIKGSSIDVGKEVLSPALLSMGVRHLDRVLLTHPHYDHYAGLASLLAEFGPRVLWTNGLDAPEKETKDWERLVSAAAASNVPMVPIGKDGLREDVGGATLVISAPSDLAAKDINDTSLIVRVTFGDRSFLFTGDLTKERERGFILSDMPLDSDVLKVGHHGSDDASSEDFLRAVSPEIAVISAGVGNPYGFPHKDVLGRIDRTGARVLRTDWHGAIDVMTDGVSIETSTYADQD